MFKVELFNLIEKNKKLILKGSTGTGKSTILFERYKYMVENLKIPSNNILILLLNRSQSLEWRKKTVLNKSAMIWRTSYYGFIQSEINNYYSLILKNCNLIDKKRIKPIFLTFESAQYIVSKVIEKRREREGLFSGVTSFSDRISIDLTANLVKAAISDINFDNIGNRLFSSLEKKDDEKKQIFRDSDNIIRAYRKKCLSIGVLDFGIAVELFNNCLLADKNYRSSLKKRIKHVIVDNIEECVPTEIDFLNTLLPNLDSCLVAYNNEGGYGSVFGGNRIYMEEKFLSKFKIANMEKNHIAGNNFERLADDLYDAVVNEKYKKNSNIKSLERIKPYELRSEMLENVGQKIIDLIDSKKYEPSDITVISTYADPVTEYVIERVISKHGYEIKNLARKSKVIDNQFTKALITLAQLCHPKYKIMPTRDDVSGLIRLLLNIDPVRSSILSNEIINQRPFADFPDLENTNLIEKIGFYNTEKYNYIKDWIRHYKDSGNLPINEFFQKVFLEILLISNVPQSHILQAKNLIDSAGNFVEVCSKFNMNANKDFLDMIRRGIKSSESIFELEEKLDGNFVLLSTPSVYLANSLESKVVIFNGISSENWTQRSMKELTNNHVLTKTWDENLIYTEKMEEENKRKYLGTLLRAIIKRTREKVITFESNLSANGFENDGILSECIDKIL
jgi:superfamily I DNA/RNA helicase